MKSLLLAAFLCTSLYANSQYGPCEKKFVGTLSIAWGTNNQKLGAAQAEAGIWGNTIPISAYVGVMAWTKSNEPVADKKQIDNTTPFCDMYFKLGVITYRGGLDARLKNEFTFTLPANSSPEVGYAVYYAAGPQLLFGLEPMYQLQSKTYGGYVRIKVCL